MVIGVVEGFPSIPEIRCNTKIASLAAEKDDMYSTSQVDVEMTIVYMYL